MFVRSDMVTVVGARHRPPKSNGSGAFSRIISYIWLDIRGSFRKAWLERGQNQGTYTELGRNLNDTYLCKAHQGHQEAVKIVFDAR